MSVINNEHTLDSDLGEDIADKAIVASSQSESTALLLPGRIITHHPKAGLNAMVDVAGYLFSMLGKLKQLTSYRNLGRLQKELLQEINTFYEAIKSHGYNAEYIVVCRYILCDLMAS